MEPQFSADLNYNLYILQKEGGGVINKLLYSGENCEYIVPSLQLLPSEKCGSYRFELCTFEGNFESMPVEITRPSKVL